MEKSFKTSKNVKSLKEKYDVLENLIIKKGCKRRGRIERRERGEKERRKGEKGNSE